MTVCMSYKSEEAVKCFQLTLGNRGKSRLFLDKKKNKMFWDICDRSDFCNHSVQVLLRKFLQLEKEMK